MTYPLVIIAVFLLSLLGAKRPSTPVVQQPGTVSPIGVPVDPRN